MSNNGKLGAGVIGLGVGDTHCEGFLQSKDAKLVAVCDLMDERLEAAGDKYGVDTYSRLDDFLALDDMQIVSVCTPDHTHIDVATKVLRAGKNLLLEKPMALSIPDCQSIMKEAERSGMMAAIGYEFRLNPAVMEIKRRIDSGEVGEVCGISMYYWRGPFMRNKYQKWIQHEKCSGGMLVEETCHWFDLLRWFGGEVAELTAYTTDKVHPDFDFEDVAYVNAKLKSRCGGTAIACTHRF